MITEPIEDSHERSQDVIATVCDEIKALLLEKNKKYGDSALSPARIFSKASAVEQILVRIDDKLSRIKTTGTEAPDEDTLQDLIGYLVLLKVAVRKTYISRISRRCFCGQVDLEDYGGSNYSTLNGDFHTRIKCEQAKGMK